MADFNSIIITNAGKEMVARAIINKEPLVFTQLKTTDSIYDTAQIENLTDLDNIKQTTTFQAANFSTPNKIVLQSSLANNNLTEGYSLNSYGIYCKTNSLNETLFAVSSVIDPTKSDWVSEFNNKNSVSIVINSVIFISNTELASVLVNSDLYVSEAIYNERVELVDNKFTEIENTINENKTELKIQIDSSMADLQGKVDSIYLPKDVIMKYDSNSTDTLNNETWSICNEQESNIASATTIEVLNDYRTFTFYHNYKMLKYAGGIYTYDYGLDSLYMMPNITGNASSDLYIKEVITTSSATSNPSPGASDYYIKSVSDGSIKNLFLDNVKQAVSELQKIAPYIGSVNYNSNYFEPVLNDVKIFTTLIQDITITNLQIDDYLKFNNYNIYYVGFDLLHAGFYARFIPNTPSSSYLISSSGMWRMPLTATADHSFLPHTYYASTNDISSVLKVKFNGSSYRTRSLIALYNAEHSGYYLWSPNWISRGTGIDLIFIQPRGNQVFYREVTDDDNYLSNCYSLIEGLKQGYGVIGTQDSVHPVIILWAKYKGLIDDTPELWST